MDFKEFEFAPAPDRAADFLVNVFTERFSNPALSKLDIARIVTGFNSIMVTSGKKFDALYFSYIREAAIKSGKLPETEFYELLTTLPEEGYGEFLSIEQIGEKVRRLKKEGSNVGLKFGHYRRLTLNHIFEFVAVRHACDHLVLIIENAERTSKFKQKRIELTDEQRINMFKKSCLVNTVGMTQGLDYSDEYYRGIVSTISPSTLFIAETWPLNVQEEYRKRAELCGAEPFVMPDISGGVNTTRMETLIFPKDGVVKLERS
jgi:hypothetical protein